jgi:predicted PurR-regulated permease PerM
MNTYDILVIILSVTLLGFLIISMVAISYLINLLKKANVIADQVNDIVENVGEKSNSIMTNIDDVVQNVESFSETAGRVATPAAAIGSIFNHFANMSKGHKKERD